MRQMPVKIVSDGVLTRSVRDTAAFFREAEHVYRDLRLPPLGDVTGPGRTRLRIAVITEGIGRSASPEVADLTMKTATLLEGLGHEVAARSRTRCPSRCGTTSCCTGRCWRCRWSAAGAVRSAAPGTAGSSTTSPRAWPPTPRAALHRLPGAIRRLRRTTRFSRDFYTDHDVLLTPTLATETPAIGHLAPTQDYDTIMERLLDWVAFTPLQNATGDPAISLPLATTAAGLPQGMMLAAGWGREDDPAEARLRGRGGRSLGPDRRLIRPSQPISRTPESLCSVLRRCPFSSVGRASPW